MSERPVVVVLGGSEHDPPPGIERAAGLAEILEVPDAGALRAALPGADALFFWRAPKAWLEDAWPRAGGLRWIQSASDGVDGLLFPALAASDVLVTNARGIFDEPIAEWAIGAIVAFATGLHRSILDTAVGRWDDDRTRGRVAGSRLLVVGPGPIGREVARRARDLGMHVTLVGRAPREDEALGQILGPDDLHDALGRADHVLDALPLTTETRGMFDAAAFAAMKLGASFLNVGRGATVDEGALIDALRAGKVAAAALDVFVQEPLPASSPLWTMPNVIVSPHTCGDFEGWERVVVELFVENLGRFVRGEPLRNPVDASAGFGVG